MERIRYVESEMSLILGDDRQLRELREARSNMILGVMRQRRWWESFDAWNCMAEGQWWRRELRRERAVAALYATHEDMTGPEYHYFGSWLMSARDDGARRFCDALLNRLDGAA
jgi:hypothetical protein